MARSLRVSKEGLKKAKEAFNLTGWTQDHLAGSVRCTRQTVSKFLAGHTIDKRIFEAICTELNLEFGEIADFELEEEQRPDYIPFPEITEWEYSRRYQKRHGTFKVLGMLEPVSLEKVYTTVQFLNKQGINFYQSYSSQELSEALIQDGQFQTQGFPQPEGIKVANTEQYLMVLGGPGAGKSTFLRRVGLEALKGKRGGYEHNKIPVLIELKIFNEGDIDLLQAIIKELEICGFPNPGMRLTKLLENGKLLLLLDGLDETANKPRDRVIELIHDFVDRYDQNRFICSCLY